MSDEPKTTPGPWRWEIVNGRLELCGGSPRYDVSVMDFVRHGMNGATARFREDVPGMNIMHKAQEHGIAAPGRDHHEWFRLVKHPDAQLIEAAPDLRDALEALRDGECFCSSAARVRDFDGQHSPSCVRATAALAKARGEAK